MWNARFWTARFWTARFWRHAAPAPSVPHDLTATEVKRLEAAAMPEKMHADWLGPKLRAQNWTGRA